MNLLTLVVILTAAVIVAAAGERLRHRIGQIPALVRQGVQEGLRAGRDHGAAIFETAVSVRVGQLLTPMNANQEGLARILRAELAAATVRSHYTEVAGEASKAAALLLRDLRRLHVLAHPPRPALPDTVRPPPRAGDTQPPEPDDEGDEGNRETGEEYTRVMKGGDRSAVLLRLPMPEVSAPAGDRR